MNFRENFNDKKRRRNILRFYKLGKKLKKKKSLKLKKKADKKSSKIIKQIKINK